MRVKPSAVCCVVLLAGWAPSGTEAQTLVIEARDESNGAPVQGASITLLTSLGEAMDAAVSDERGRVVLEPSAAGDYVIQATRLGYEAYRSPLIALGVEGSVTLELPMRPEPIGLDALDVVVEAQAVEFLGILGLSAVQLGSRWIDRAEIDAVGMPGGPQDIIRWQNIPGVRVQVTDSAGIRVVCVKIRERGCALTVLNGALIPSRHAFNLDARSLEAIAVLRPMEAATLYGTFAGGGAVLLWTRRGR